MTDRNPSRVARVVVAKVVDGAVKAFDFAIAGCDERERGIELSEVFAVDFAVELAKVVRTKAKLAAGQAPTFDLALIFEMIEVRSDVAGKFNVFV